jgi:hypothetical protein
MTRGLEFFSFHVNVVTLHFHIQVWYFYLSSVWRYTRIEHSSLSVTEHVFTVSKFVGSFFVSHVGLQ